jgi:hypothetical protein
MIVILILAMACFIASLTLHVSAFFTDALAPDLNVWVVLHILCMVACAPVVYVVATRVPRKNRRNPWTLAKACCTGAPRWMLVVLAGLFVYTTINFILFQKLAQGGRPEVQDHQYVLANQGRITSTLSEAEYHEANALLMRGFSGHWLFFTWAASVVYVAETRRRKATTQPFLSQSPH